MIRLNDISPFMIREIPTEIKRWKGIKENNIEHPLGYVRDGGSIWIVTEGFRGYISLTKFLEEKKDQLTKKDKIRILISISNTMNNLIKLDERNSHGHLCPNNILVICFIICFLIVFRSMKLLGL